MSSTLTMKQLELFSNILKQFKPKPKINCLEFAKKEGYLSPESSAVTGRFVPFPYQEDILRDTSDDEIELMVWLKSTRVGYTKIVNFSVAYDIAEDPCPQLILQPNDGKAGEWSKKEFKPLIRDMKIVGDKILKSREENNLNYKAYPGGLIESRGGKTANNYASGTFKKVRYDEYSRFPDDVDKEGDPYELGKKRMESYWNGQVMIGSTPTIKGMDKTENRFNETDKKYRFLPCPYCGHYQTIDFFKQIKWEKEVREGVTIHLTHTAYMECENCKGKIEHKQKRNMDSKGRWNQTKEFYCCDEWQNPIDNRRWFYNEDDKYDKRNGEALCKKCGTTAEYNRIGRKKRGYHIWAGYSFQPNTTWATIAETYINAVGSVDKMRAFFNTWLGESFEEKTLKLDNTLLMDRIEDYKTLPNETKIVLITVDTQNDRLEYLIKAWVMGETSYNIEYGKILGDPENQFVWDELLKIKRKKLQLENGKEVSIFRGFIDMGGQRTDHVKKFVNENSKDFIMLKGDDKEVRTNDARPLAQIKTSQVDGSKIMWVATTKAKDIVFERLMRSADEYGFIHHNQSFTKTWFDMLTAEKKIFKKNKKGYIEGTYVNQGGKRNEALDLEVYQLAAVRLLQSEIKGFTLQMSNID